MSWQKSQGRQAGLEADQPRFSRCKWSSVGGMSNPFSTNITSGPIDRGWSHGHALPLGGVGRKATVAKARERSGPQVRRQLAARRPLRIVVDGWRQSVACLTNGKTRCMSPGSLSRAACKIVDVRLAERRPCFRRATGTEGRDGSGRRQMVLWDRLPLSGTWSEDYVRRMYRRLPETVR